MADSDSSIAWHRAQIRKLRETLRDFETGGVSEGKIARAKETGRGRESLTGVRRKLGQFEQIVDAYDRRHVRRPRGTDSQSLAGVRST